MLAFVSMAEFPMFPASLITCDQTLKANIRAMKSRAVDLWARLYQPGMQKVPQAYLLQFRLGLP